MPEPPHSLHLWRSLPCSHMLPPPHSLHRLGCLPCLHLRDGGVRAGRALAFIRRERDALTTAPRRSRRRRRAPS
eukprot:173896-Prymnesium_polylepis.1